MKEVELPESLTYMSNMTFGKCVNLLKVVIPENVTSINAATFKKSENVVLYVVKDSYAHEYAVANNIAYELVDNNEENPGEPETTGKIVNENGTLYYYENGVKTYAGLICLDEEYYYVRSSGQLVVNATYWITKNNDLLPVGNYTFDAEGKMIIQ